VANLAEAGRFIPRDDSLPSEPESIFYGPSISCSSSRRMRRAGIRGRRGGAARKARDCRKWIDLHGRGLRGRNGLFVEGRTRVHPRAPDAPVESPVTVVAGCGGLARGAAREAVTVLEERPRGSFSRLHLTAEGR
jgi:hypothetical protein